MSGRKARHRGNVSILGDLGRKVFLRRAVAQYIERTSVFATFAKAAANNEVSLLRRVIAQMLLRDLFF